MIGSALWCQCTAHPRASGVIQVGISTLTMVSPQELILPVHVGGSPRQATFRVSDLREFEQCSLTFKCEWKAKAESHIVWTRRFARR